MYESHFGISAPPFQLSPDPSFYFDSRGHHEALVALRRALADESGFVVVSGEIGAGKTMLVRTMLEELNPARIVVGQVLSTQLDDRELMRAILGAFEAPAPTAESQDAGALAQALQRHLETLATARQRAVLIVDEAQNLHDSAFAILLSLDALRGPGRAPLLIGLVGQPELRERLEAPALAAMQPRVRARYHLGPLDSGEVGAYVLHRLEKVGWQGTPSFDPCAFEAIERWTGGVPRRVNRLCNRLLLAQFLQSRQHIDAAAVEETARELLAEVGEGGGPPARGAAATPQVATERERLAELARPGPPPSAPPPPAPPVEELHLELLPVPEVVESVDPPAFQDSRVDFPDITGPGELDALAPVEPEPPPEPAQAGVPVVPVTPAVPPRPIAPTPPPTIAPPVLTEIVNPPPGTRRVAGGVRPLLCVVGTQGDHIKAAALMRALADRHDVPVTVLVRCYANNAFERNRAMFDGLDVDGRLIGLGIGGGTHAGRAAELMKRFELAVQHCRPGAVIVFDGSDAALSCGLVANRHQVPVLHVGGGLRATDPPDAADITRKLADQLSDLLFVSEPQVQERLAAEGTPAERLRVVGNLLVDALQAALRHPADALTPERLGLPPDFVTGRNGYGLVAIDHPANINDRQHLTDLVGLLKDVAHDVPLIWAMHARTRDQLMRHRLDAQVAAERIACLPALPYPTHARLLANATCVLTDSWNVQEEATALGIPCLTVGVAPERGITAAIGSNTVVGLNRALATRTVWECLFNGGRRGRVPEAWDGRTGARIAEQIAAYLVLRRQQPAVSAPA